MRTCSAHRLCVYINKIVLAYISNISLHIEGIIMKNGIIKCLILCSLLLHQNANAGLSINAFAGLSGTSMVIFLVDSITDSDGAITDTASEYGLITGEFGFAVDLFTDYFGIRAEASAGYYKYRVLDLPNTAYTMYLMGIEPYIAFQTNGNKTILGVGFGQFVGNQWDEVFGQSVSAYKNHRGYALWGVVGYRWKNLELNARIRYHRFTHINEIELASYEGNDYEEFQDDYVFVLRICALANLL